jgi:hypothetical protein
LLIFFIFARNAGDVGLFDPFFTFEYAHGLVDMFAGLAFLFLPSLRAFFQYQRTGQPTSVARGWQAAAVDAEHQPLPSPVAGGMWGAILGGVSGLALSRLFAQHFGLGYAIQEATHGLLNETLASLLAGMLAGGLLGLFVGLVVGMVRPKPDTRRGDSHSPVGSSPPRSA